MSCKSFSITVFMVLICAGIFLSSLDVANTLPPGASNATSGLTDDGNIQPRDIAIIRSDTEAKSMPVDGSWWAGVQKNLAEYEYHASEGALS